MSRSIEVIDRLRREEAEAARREAEAARQAELERQRKAEERERQRIEEQKRQAQIRTERVKINARIARESGVLSELGSIERRELRKVKSAIVQNMEYGDKPEGRILLVWGKKFQVTNGDVSGVRSSYSTGLFSGRDFEDADYSVVEVRIDPESGSIRVEGGPRGEWITAEEWRSDPGALPEAIGAAFIAPHRHHWTEADERRRQAPSFSSSSYHDECCHN